ncbi:hypothetical protein SAMN02910456_00855 [Ruminococcaceae bacterium YRB3002]|nr:hypothetical protein SAMN02910456_00855 [Ruminococcaceae bacterium YRB3002]
MASKKYEEMTDHELMVEMLKAQQKDARRGLAAAISGFTIALVFAVAFAILIPVAITSLKKIDEAVTNCTVMIENATVTIEQAQTTLEGIDTMTEGVNDIVNDNTQAVSDALDEINSIDIDQLNQAINDLASIVKPLAKLFNGG